MSSKGEPIGGWLVLEAKDFRTMEEGNPELIGSTWYWSVYSIEAMLAC